MKITAWIVLIMLILTQLNAQTLKQSNEQQSLLLISELETLSKTELIETIIDIEKIYLEEIDLAIEQAYNKGFDLAIKQVESVKNEVFFWQVVTCGVSIVAGVTLIWSIIK